MKRIITAALLLLSFAIQAQDFDYTFYAKGYTQRINAARVDSATAKIVQIADSTYQEGAYRVTKTGNRIEIADVFGLAPVYSEAVKMVGTDKHGAIVYEAVTTGKEAVVVVPGKFVFVVFQTQSLVSKKLDTIQHFFGVFDGKYLFW